MDGQIVVGVLSMTATLGAAVISARANVNARHARQAGVRNEAKLERLEMHTDRRQQKLITKAAEAVAKEHPELLTAAIADSLVRDVLEAILEGAQTDRGISPMRRDNDGGGLR